MKCVEFVVPGRPSPKGSWKSIGKGRLVPQNKRARVFEQAVALRARYEAIQPAPREVAVAVYASCFFVRPPSHFRTSGELKGASRPHPTYQNLGDSDKIGRAILDALTGVLYEDDSQVIDLQIEKRWTTEQERTVIRVSFVGM